MHMRRHWARNTLSDVWGISKNNVSTIYKTWIPKWGEMGEFLSRIQLTEEFLTDTTPQSYGKVGLEKIAALSDGKDYMIEIPRSNPLLTRAAYSDKVHHSALRQISWSTPTGLNFEHTDLFLGRVSEKKLVELWGPRLQSAPAGWYTSEVGFSRVTNERALKDVVLYRDLKYTNDICNWAHGGSNLLKPLQQ